MLVWLDNYLGGEGGIRESICYLEAMTTVSEDNNGDNTILLKVEFREMYKDKL
jgi:hypothetical protein